MYNFIESYVRDKKVWKKQDVLNVSLSSVIAMYEDVHITLEYQGERVNWRPEHTSIFSDIQNSSMTTLQWLTHINGSSQLLETTSTPFGFDKLEKVYSYDAQAIGFNLERSNHKIHPESTANLVGDDFRLYRDNTDYQKMAGQILVTVNGLFCPLVINNHGIYLQLAKYSLEDRGVWDVGITDFSKIGGVKLEPIDRSRYYKQEGTAPSLYHNCCYNLRHDVTNKTIGVVLDGYLHILDDVVEIIGKTTVRINWNKVPLLKRAVDNPGRQMGSDSFRNDKEFTESTVISDDWIKSILHSEYSFFVVFNKPNISKSYNSLIPTDLDGVYTYPRKLSGMAFTKNGKCLTYMVQGDKSSYFKGRDNEQIYNLALVKERQGTAETMLKGKTQKIPDGVVGGSPLVNPEVDLLQLHTLPDNF